MINNNMDFIRVGCSTPDIQTGNLSENTKNIIDAISLADEKGTGLLLLPSLAITGHDCGNLFLQRQLYDKQIESLNQIVDSTKSKNVTVVLDYYENKLNALYKMSAIIQKGEIRHVVANNNLSQDERDFFAVATDDCNDILFMDDTNNITIGFSPICDIQLLIDSTPPLVGQASYMKNYTSSLSGSWNNIVLSSDTNGLCTISENGKLLAHTTSFSEESLILADVDMEIVRHDKIANPHIHMDLIDERHILPLQMWENSHLLRNISPTPFKPESDEALSQNCFEIFEIQATALAKRLSRTKSSTSVVGISGGLDSTLALLVTAYAHKKLKKDSNDIIAITMPGFGTTDRTYDNALNMMKHVGATIKEIPITSAVTQHFKDISHDINEHDVTYENAQARERTQILMDIANKENGIVVGTGDLSEEALGWCTFNGDHMSMFGVNAGVPKTVIKYIVRWFIDTKLNEGESFSLNDKLLAATLEDILNTPISPELLPPDAEGNISQKTEEKVGPYDLHDFFIYYTVRYGTKPLKLLRLAEQAFGDKYSNEFILQWLKVFYRRFFTQQFKRSCSPDSPVIGSVDLSPSRWSMPSDASYAAWLSDLDKL